MEQELINKLQWRKTLINNADALVKHGKKANKTAQMGQGNLFAAVEVDITPELKSEDITYGEAVDLLKKETEILGVNLTFDEFSPYYVISKALCTTSLKELIEGNQSASNQVLLVKVVEIQYRNTKTGKPYAMVEVEAEGYKQRMFMFGDEYRKNIRKLFLDNIYLIRAVYNKKGMMMLNFAQEASTINASKYIDGYTIKVTKKKYLGRIKVMLWTSKDTSGLKFNYELDEEQYSGTHDITLNSEKIHKLTSLGCQIKILKKK